MTSALEDKVQRNLTTVFINADPKDIRLLRTKKVPNGSGGYTLEEDPASPLPPQRMRLIPATRELTERETSVGTKVVPELTLLAQYDADLKRFDQFVDQGVTYEVIWVYQKRTYETKAEIIAVRGAS